MSNLADLTIGFDADATKADKVFDDLPKGADEAVSKTERKFDGMGKTLAVAGAAAGAAAGTALAIGVAEAFEREQTSDKLAAVLSLGADESAAAGKVAGELYAGAYGESLGQVNEAIDGVVSTLEVEIGDSDSLERLSAKALDTATAFDLDLDTAIARVGTLMKTGLVKDADEGFDLLVTGMQTVPRFLRGDMTDAINEYSKHFAGMGISGSEAIGLLSSASDTIELDKMGDAVKELGIRATDMSAATQLAFFNMGMDGHDMANRILAGGDTARGAFDEIIDGLLKIEDPAARSMQAIALFGTPVEDLSHDQLPAFLTKLDTMGNSLGEVEGAADAMGATLNDNAATKIETSKRAIEGWLAGIVEAPGLLGDVATQATAMGQTIAPLAPAIGGLALVFKDSLGSIGKSMASGIATGAKWSGSMVSNGAKYAADLGKRTANEAKWAAQSVGNYAKSGAAAVGHGAKVAISKGATLAAAAASKVWAGAQWLLNAALNANPIGLIIAAVVGLVAAAVLAYQKVDWFRAAVDAAWSAISSVISWAWDTVIKPIMDNWQVALAVLMGPIGLLGYVVKENWDKIAGAVSWAWNSVIKPIWDAIVGHVKVMVGVFQFLWGVAGNVWSAISGAVSSAWGVLGSVFSWIGSAVQTYVVAHFNIVKSVASTVWAGVTGAISGAWNTISSIFGWIRGAAQGVIDSFWNIKDGIGSAFSTLAGMIRGPFESAFSAIRSLWNNTVGGFSFSVPDWIPGVGGKGFSIPNMHTGGIVPGRPGEEVLRVLEAGELVVPAAQVSAMGAPRPGAMSAAPSATGGGASMRPVLVDARGRENPYDVGKAVAFEMAVER